MQNVATKMKLGNGANELDVTNTHNYRTSLSQIVKYVHTFPKKVDVEYTSFLEEHEHALAKACVCSSRNKVYSTSIFLKKFGRP